MLKELIQNRLSELAKERGAITKLSKDTGLEKSYLNKVANKSIPNMGSRQLYQLFCWFYPAEASNLDLWALKEISDLEHKKSNLDARRKERAATKQRSSS